MIPLKSMRCDSPTSLVPATIARMSRGCAARFRGFVDAIRERVKAAAVKHMDETGNLAPSLTLPQAK